MINIHTITNTPPQMPNALVSRVKKQAANVCREVLKKLETDSE